MLVFIGAFIMVFFAEMGDKSQLLAMSLATRYPLKVVLGGVILATLLNNGLAILMGVYLRASLNLEMMQVIASLSFIFFGLWKLLEKEELWEEPQNGKALWGPFVTVTLALFLAEMGDKTQLATIAYVIKYNAPFLTLLGVVSGMFLADALGIFAGAFLCRLLSERVLKLLSSSIFILIGVTGLYLSLLT